MDEFGLFAPFFTAFLKSDKLEPVQTGYLFELMTCLNKHGNCLANVLGHGVLSLMVSRVEDQSLASCVQMFIGACEEIDGFGELRDSTLTEMIRLVSGSDVAKRLSAVKIVGGVFEATKVEIGLKVAEQLFSVGDMNKDHLALLRSYCIRV